MRTRSSSLSCITFSCAASCEQIRSIMFRFLSFLFATHAASRRSSFPSRSNITKTASSSICYRFAESQYHRLFPPLAHFYRSLWEKRVNHVLTDDWEPGRDGRQECSCHRAWDLCHSLIGLRSVRREIRRSHASLRASQVNPMREEAKWGQWVTSFSSSTRRRTRASILLTQCAARASFPPSALLS